MSNKSFIWAWAIKNVVCVICWTVLAVVFSRWWVALFAVLFLSDVRTISKHYRICDVCGKHSPYADNYNEALDRAKSAGWVHFIEGNKDYCPNCQKERGNL